LHSAKRSQRDWLQRPAGIEFIDNNSWGGAQIAAAGVAQFSESAQIGQKKRIGRTVRKNHPQKMTNQTNFKDLPVV
jgi:hypothetical protein